jgi:2-polyprenyl-6-methoxyphenol hydroxylase-like FAD-dependent oxidoreductase
MPEIDQTHLPLIAGAGPVGLAAALFLARGGVPARIIERRQHPSTQSRALAVNPRTLDLLEPTGVTAKMLELGLPIRGGQFWRNGKVVAQVSFSELQHKYPFMLALSQATTERLLEDALRDAGGSVERGVELIDCRNKADHVDVEFRRGTADGRAEHLTCPWLLGADGARSTARGMLGLAFEGSTLAREWHLADVPMETTLAEDHAHAFFLDDGAFVFCLRVIEDKNNSPKGAPLWRIIANLPQPIERLEMARAAGPAVWASRFRIEHRIAERLQEGHVFLAGDAAHVHSPIGARGMNLGIEDAWTFSRLLLEGQSQRYGPLRRKIDGRVVRQIERLTGIVRGESGMSRFIRRWLLPRAVGISALRNRAIKTLTGLDHPLMAQPPSAVFEGSSK